MSNTPTYPVDELNHWFLDNYRPLPWRLPECSPWGILLSEVMSQQTPVARVEPIWREWMQRWPDPRAFAAASKDDVLRAWSTLGYPRRALRLHECAQAIVARHGGEVPADVGHLLDLPGIGEYTARAVACFAYGQAAAVVDTNVRRVIARSVHGKFLQGQPRRTDLADMAALIPQVDALSGKSTGELVTTKRPYSRFTVAEKSALFSAAIMELGARICTSRKALCDQCPLQSGCAWFQAGCPEPTEEEKIATARRVQKFEGTDRQVRGKIMAIVREASSPVEQSLVAHVSKDPAQVHRAVYSLLDDGLLVESAGLLALPR